MLAYHVFAQCPVDQLCCARLRTCNLTTHSTLAGAGGAHSLALSTDKTSHTAWLNAQVLDVTARGARLRVSHLGSLELVQALAEAYSHYVFAPYVSPYPQVWLASQVLHYARFPVACTGVAMWSMHMFVQT